MTGRLRHGARLAVGGLLVAACGSPVVTPAPAATPSPTADPRVEEIEEGRGVWDRRGPGTVAYDTVETLPDGSGLVVHVSEMDGRAEVQPVEAGGGGATAGPDQTIDRIFDRALEAVATGRDATIAYDTTYGHVTSLAWTDATGGSSSVEVRNLTTPADRGGAARARAALDDLLSRWRARESPAWAYTWSRFVATDTPATATRYAVVHEDGRTTVAAADGSTGAAAPPGSATIQGTVELAVGVLAAGGWVDVAIEPAELDALIAVDPSPSATGDAYWIRVDATDLYATRAREALDAARARWVAAGLGRYRYRWRYDGEDGRYGWDVVMDSGVSRLRPTRGAPPVETAFVAPRVDELFALIERVVAEGGTVTVTYDRALGYPARVEIRGAGAEAPDGVITIARFRER